MKSTHHENDHSFNINLTPETVKEVAELFRFANNAKKVPAEIYLSFSQWNTDGVPYLNIRLSKKTGIHSKTGIQK